MHYKQRMSGLRDAEALVAAILARARGHPRRGGRRVRAAVDRRAVGGGGRRRGRHGVRGRPPVARRCCSRASRSSRARVAVPARGRRAGHGRPPRAARGHARARTSRSSSSSIRSTARAASCTRSGRRWVLTGVAPYRGGARDAGRHRARGADRDPAGEAAPVRHAVGDRGRRRARRARQSRHRRRAGRSRCGRRAPTTIDQGFGGVASFFPGARAELAAIDDEVVRGRAGPAGARDARWRSRISTSPTAASSTSW